MVFRFFRRDPERRSVQRFFVCVVEASRNPILFTLYGIPDTLEGRFEALIFHISLVQQRFKLLGSEAGKAAQLLTDALFANLDAAIREVGVSDVGVPKKMKVLAESYFGRLAAYEAMFQPGGDPARTLARNALGVGSDGGQDPRAVGLAGYASRVVAMLSVLDQKAILALDSLEFTALTEGIAGRPGK